MQIRTLGKNLAVSAIGLGCMTIGKDYSTDAKREAERIIRRAHEMGVTMLRQERITCRRSTEAHTR